MSGTKYVMAKCRVSLNTRLPRVKEACSCQGCTYQRHTEQCLFDCTNLCSYGFIKVYLAMMPSFCHAMFSLLYVFGSMIFSLIWNKLATIVDRALFSRAGLWRPPSLLLFIGKGETDGRGACCWHSVPWKLN